MNYLQLYKQAKLTAIRDKLNEKLNDCTLCPRNCRVNRLKEEIGFCGVGKDPIISSVFLHFNEEPEIVGRGGSGTIFFCGCNLGCIYCQNYTISHIGEGHRVNIEGLADSMLNLQEQGAENINFVTPTHLTARWPVVRTTFHCRTR